MLKGVVCLHACYSQPALRSPSPISDDRIDNPRNTGRVTQVGPKLNPLRHSTADDRGGCRSKLDRKASKTGASRKSSYREPEEPDDIVGTSLLEISKESRCFKTWTSFL